MKSRPSPLYTPDPYEADTARIDELVKRVQEKRKSNAPPKPKPSTPPAAPLFGRD